MSTLLTETVEPFPSYEEVPEQEKMAQICLIYNDPDRFGATAAWICDYADTQPPQDYDECDLFSALEKPISDEIWALLSALSVMLFALFYHVRPIKVSGAATKVSGAPWVRQVQESRWSEATEMGLRWRRSAAVRGVSRRRDGKYGELVNALEKPHEEEQEERVQAVKKEEVTEVEDLCREGFMTDEHSAV
ncbi:hypothetical protein Tdes44962_MAKER09657 [Teratosphaeria destructans]|uniref:Uncharacterized protein n=1 Tax=Teratosphaeria destructans TaxID=418781 RepID=A0A9W7SSH5_9PEZI|nr:hypothetical protein Tdes44962_MAKER09657 [Teratosphaeria destructans]